MYYTREPAAHEGGEATCTVQAVCTVCGEPYGELAAHEGGEATCIAQAVCTVCCESYGELAAHEADENGRCKYGCGAIYAFKVNEEYYLTLEKALVVASEIEDSTVVLLANVSLDYYLTVDSGKFTIDLNGYTWTSSSWALYVEGNAWLTITDTSEAQSGMLVGTRQGHPTIVLRDDATLNVAGGTIGHDVSSVINITESGNPVNADFILSGGVLKGGYGILAQGNSVTITGGTIDSKDYDILWHQGTLDLSQYQNPHGMLIDIYHEDMTAYPLLPEGYELVEDGYDYMVVHTAHEGGTATCTAQAVCTVCGEPYGELAAHEYDNACDGNCNVCNVDAREPAAHVDTDTNGKCDVCGADVPVAPPVNPDDSSSDENSSNENSSNSSDSVGPDNSSESSTPNASSSNSSSAAPVTPPATSNSESSEKEGCSGTIGGLSVATLALGGLAILLKKRKEN